MPPSARLLRRSAGRAPTVRWPASRSPPGWRRCRRPPRRGWPAAAARRRGASPAAPSRSVAPRGQVRVLPEATLASASAVIASPFHDVTTLSSRPGWVRVSRAPSSSVRTRSSRCGSSGSVGNCSTDVPCSKVPDWCDRENLGGPTAVVAAEHLGQLFRRPDIGRALAAVGVGIQRRREHRAVGQLVKQKSRGLRGDPAGQRISGTPGPVRVGAQQQRVVVQHLLEMRYYPGVVDAVPGEAAGQLVIDAAAGHRVARVRDGLQRRR